MPLIITIRNTNLVVELTDEHVEALNKPNSEVSTTCVDTSSTDSRPEPVIVRRIDRGLLPRYVFQTQHETYQMPRVPGLPVLYDPDKS